MRYCKPTLTTIGTASAHIQQFHIKGENVPDSHPMQSGLTTGGAYDLDE
jgi:hypothetical protein